MSSTNKTTNLELSQFIGSDSPKWLTDYNADMEKIDAGYQTVKAQADATDLIVGGHTSSISTLQDTTTSQGTAITQLRTDVNGNSGSINTINELLGSGEPTTSNKTIIGAINELDSKEGSLTLLETRDKTSLVNAINEVNEKGWSFTVVHVTADGVKTLSALMDELHAAITTAFNNLNATYFYPISVFGPAIGLGASAVGWFVRNAINSPIIFTVDYINETSPSDGIIHNQYNVKTSGSVAFSGNSSTGTYTNISTTVPTSGQTMGIEIMYRLD